MNEGIRVLGNRYEIGELLGRGGMAEVHLGRDARLGRVVAIKLLRNDLARDPTFQARFRREAQSAAGLNHPAIVAVYDTGEEVITDAAGNAVALPFIVMEYVEGRTLRELLTEGRTLDVDLALEVTSGVLSALEYSHRNGIVHRDIKPANVMLTPGGDVKVMDFGIARALADASTAMTQTQAVIGTAQYLSPEQARGEAVDVRSDLYSTGCLLFELLTGRPPFVADSPVAVAYQHVREMPQPPSAFNPSVPEAVDRIVLHALTKDREDRYQTAADFRGDVESARAGRRVVAPVPVPAAGPPTAATEYFPQGPPPQAGYGGYPPAGYPQGGYSPYQPQTGGFPTTGQDWQADEPPPSKRGPILAALAVIVLLVGALVAWNQFTKSPTADGNAATVAVPADLVGKTFEAVQTELTGLGFTVKPDPQPLAADGNPDDVNKVTEVSPTGAQPKGAEITVTYWAPPGKVTVPDLVGKSQTEAGQLLGSAGLVVGDIKSKSDPNAQPGEVLETDPAAGQEVEPGSKVNLVVASGEVEVPDVVGLSQSEAKDKLNRLGLQVNVSQQPSDQPPGTVIEQDPRAGRTVKAGSTVDLVVAKAKPEPTTSTPPPTPTSTPTGTPTP